MDDPEIHREVFRYVTQKSNDICIVLSVTMEVIWANSCAARFFSQPLAGEHIGRVIPEYEKILGCGANTDSSERETMLNIPKDSDVSQSYYFQCRKLGGNILLLGRLDAEELQTAGRQLFSLNQELNDLSRELHKKNADLEKALRHVKTLQGILPICAHCHKIRNDQEAWKALEEYIEAQTDARFSHSICPECLNTYYPEDDDGED